MDKLAHVSPDGSIRVVAQARGEELLAIDVVRLAQEGRHLGERFCGATVVNNTHWFFYEKI